MLGNLPDPPPPRQPRPMLRLSAAQRADAHHQLRQVLDAIDRGASSTAELRAPGQAAWLTIEGRP